MISRTPWQTLVALAVGAGAVSYVIAQWRVSRGNVPLPISPVVAVVLFAVAVVLFFLGRSVRRFTQGKRASMNPLHAVRILMFAKASALAGALQLGFFVAHAAVALAHPDSPEARAQAITSGAAAVACLVLVVVALVVEWFCRVPPVDVERGERGTPAR